MRILAAFVVSLCLASWALAQEGMMELPPDTTQESTAAEGEAHAKAKEIGPTLPDDTRWAGVMVIVIAGMFVAAAVIGPVVRANAPEEVPVAHAHDEPPGSSHHHGANGTINPESGHEDHGHGHGTGGHH